jgi:hypothetical protein
MIYLKEISGKVVSTEKVREPSRPGGKFWTKFVLKQFAPVDTNTGQPRGKDQEYEIKMYREKAEDITKYNIAPGRIVNANLALYGESYSTNTGLGYSLNLVVMQINSVA